MHNKFFVVFYVKVVDDMGIMHAVKPELLKGGILNLYKENFGIFETNNGLIISMNLKKIIRF